MTRHDEIRQDRALKVKDTIYDDRETELEELVDALRGLQSTDDPELVPLHDFLMKRYNKLTNKP